MANRREYEPCCALCEFSCVLDASDAFLCRKKGPVRALGRCRRFSPDLLKLEPDARRPAKLRDDLDFSIEPSK